MSDDTQIKVELAAFKTLLTEHIAHQRETNERLTQICEANDKKIRGNGHGPGLDTRVDRLEQKQKTRNYWHGAAGVTLMATAIRYWWDKWT